MGGKLIIRLLLLIVLLLPCSKGRATDLSPYLNNFGLAYYATYTESQCNDIADKFDAAIVTPEECRSYIKARKPSFIVFEYTNISNVTSGDPLDVYLENQASPETYFLNATSDSVQDVNGGKYTRLTGQRLCSYPSSPWCVSDGASIRWRTDYWTSAGRSKLVSFYTDPENWAANTDGWFFDNQERGCGGPTSVLDSGSADNGINPGDYIGSFGAIPEGHCNSLKTLMESEIVTSAERWALQNYSYGSMTCSASSGWGNRVCVDSCNGVSLGYNIAEYGCISSGHFFEFTGQFYATFSETAGWAAEYKRLYDVWLAKGSPTTRTMYVMWWRPTGATGISNNSDRVKMYALGSHLLYQFSTMYMTYDSVGVDNTHPETNRYFGAMSAPFGEPIGQKDSLDSRTYKRIFNNGIVVVRYRTASGDNYTDNGEYELGDTYYTVNADGTYGSQVSTITLANAQAFIGIKNKNYPSNTGYPLSGPVGIGMKLIN